MNTYNLKGQVAVVTGGAQGIGFSVIERLYAGGAKIASWDINQDQNQSAVKNLSKDIHAEHCDVTDFSSVERALKNTENAFGPVTILVHSAGIAVINEPIHSYDNNEWEKVIKINLTGTYNVNKALIKTMRDQNSGRIVNIASIAVLPISIKILGFIIAMCSFKYSEYLLISECSGFLLLGGL